MWAFLAHLPLQLTTSQAANSTAQHSQLLTSAPLNQMPGWLPAAPTCCQELVAYFPHVHGS